MSKEPAKEVKSSKNRGNKETAPKELVNNEVTSQVDAVVTADVSDADSDVTTTGDASVSTEDTSNRDEPDASEDSASVTDSSDESNSPEAEVSAVIIPAVTRNKTRYLPVLNSISSGLVVGLVEVEDEALFVHSTCMVIRNGVVSVALVSDEGKPMGVVSSTVLYGVQTLVLDSSFIPDAQELAAYEKFIPLQPHTAASDHRMSTLLDLNTPSN